MNVPTVLSVQCQNGTAFSLVVMLLVVVVIVAVVGSSCDSGWGGVHVGGHSGFSDSCHGGGGDRG